MEQEAAAAAAAQPVRSPLSLRRRVTVPVPRRQSSRSLSLTDFPNTRHAPLQPLMKYAVPSMLVLITLRYDDALFEENPTPLWSFAATTVFYWLVVGGMRMRMEPRKYETLRRFALAFGVQSLLSLLSMFLPHPLSLLPLLILVPVALFFAYTWISPRIMGVIEKLRDSKSSNQQPRNLPV